MFGLAVGIGMFTSVPSAGTNIRCIAHNSADLLHALGSARASEYTSAPTVQYKQEQTQDYV